MHCRCHVSFLVCFYKCCVADDHLHIGRHQPDDKDDDDDVRWKCNLPSALFYISVLPQPPQPPRHYQPMLHTQRSLPNPKFNNPNVGAHENSE